MADDITVKVGFDGTQAETGLGKLRKESESFSSQLTQRLAGAFAAMTLFDRGVAFATKTFEKFADVADKAQRAGISAEDFQRIGYAAELSGSSMEAAAKAMREIRNATADASTGAKKATDALLALGYTQEEINKGGISTTDVLLRTAAAYKAAGSDAEKFAIASSIFSTRTASEMIPLLSTSQGDLKAAMGRDVVSSEVAEQMKAIADQTKMATQALEMFTVGLISAFARGFASTAIIGMESQIALETDAANFYRSKGNEQRAKEYEKSALAGFESYAQYFRTANIGRVIDGELMTSKRTEEILNQKFADMGFSPKLQRERQQAQADAAASTQTGTMGLTASKEPATVIADSLAAVGGGGGVYASDTVDLASRTANATERMADTLDEIAGKIGESSPVSSD